MPDRRSRRHRRLQKRLIAFESVEFNGLMPAWRVASVDAGGSRRKRRLPHTGAKADAFLPTAGEDDVAPGERAVPHRLSIFSATRARARGQIIAAAHRRRLGSSAPPAT
jgi:hypothetical protein